MRPTVPQLLLDLFEKRLVDHRFKWFREGDPIILPQSQMPALLVTEDTTRWEADATGYDKATHTLRIQVVLNKKADFGNKDQASSLDKKLDEIVQGRDEAGALLPNTIMGVLRKDFTLEGLSIQSIGTVEKGFVARSEELTTAEARITLELQELVPIVGRE
jgi:hypothetical protein